MSRLQPACLMLGLENKYHRGTAFLSGSDAGGWDTNVGGLAVSARSRSSSLLVPLRRVLARPGRGWGKQ